MNASEARSFADQSPWGNLVRGELECMFEVFGHQVSQIILSFSERQSFLASVMNRPQLFNALRNRGFGFLYALQEVGRP
jgi:hypothetical protein